MQLSYYIYYKVAPDNFERVKAVVHQLQSDIASATGVQGRLQCRRDKPETWMEIYEGISDSAVFEAALHSALQRTRFMDYLAPDARRMTELFRPL